MASPSAAPLRRMRFATPALLLGAATLLIHFATNGEYGFFRDELYFIVCGERLAWGYVDHPPLVPAIARLSRDWLGPSLFALRFVPALVMAATVALTADLARRFGAGRFGQVLAGSCVLIGGDFLAFGTILSTDVLQPLSWTATCTGVVLLLQGRDKRWWLALGLVIGVSLLSKYQIALLLIALIPTALLSPLRRDLATPWPYAGAAIAAALVLPNLAWQAGHGWPFLDFIGAAAGAKNVALGPLGLLAAQIASLNPITLPVWLAGAIALAVSPRLRWGRPLAAAYPILFALVVAAHGKEYYMVGVFPLLFAAGGTAIEAMAPSIAVRAVALLLLATAGAALAPLALPVLPVDRLIAYSRRLGVAPVATERNRLGALPQYFADMFGWPEMAAEVARVYHALPPDERARAVFFGRNYGEAAAIDVYGPAYGLPPAISGHNSYFLWGPRGHDGSVVIRLGEDAAPLRERYATVEQAGRIDDRYAMPYETDLSVFVLRGRKTPFVADWADVRDYD